MRLNRMRLNGKYICTVELEFDYETEFFGITEDDIAKSLGEDIKDVIEENTNEDVIKNVAVTSVRAVLYSDTPGRDAP